VRYAEHVQAMRAAGFTADRRAKNKLKLRHPRSLAKPKRGTVAQQAGISNGWLSVNADQLCKMKLLRRCGYTLLSDLPQQETSAF